jgi:hypothetical protein
VYKLLLTSFVIILKNQFSWLRYYNIYK